jgi:Domain of unknown function (DUF4153)
MNRPWRQLDDGALNSVTEIEVGKAQIRAVESFEPRCPGVPVEAKPLTSATRAALPAILIAAVIQGWALYALHRAIEAHAWPATRLAWLLALYSVVALLPATFELLVEHVRKPPLWGLLSLLGAVVFYFGWHHGSAVADWEGNRFAASGEFFPLAFVLIVWWLHVLPFIQNRLAAGRWTMDYPLLFTHAWRNIIALAEGALFTGLFWLILWLWQSLFHMLGFDFFRDLFSKPLFVYPVTSIVFGCALHLVGSIDRLVSAVLEQILNVLKWLAPVAGVLLALFTAALLVKLPGLISAGSRAIGAGWLLWLIAVIVLFLNAAYRDGTVERPYPGWMSQAIRFCIPLTVIVSLTAICALSVRTSHYGLTAERVWAFIVAGAALIYSIGYAGAAFRSGRWLGWIAEVNVVAAVALIAAVAAALTPLLSPYRLSANSQFHLILDGRYRPARNHPLATDPYRYLRFYCGQYGRRRLAALAQLRGHPDAERIRALAAEELAQTNPWTRPPVIDASERVAQLPIYPAGRRLDPDLAKVLIANWGNAQAGMYELPNSVSAMAGVFVDLDGGGTDEFVVLSALGGPVYQSRSGHWQYIGRVRPEGFTHSWQALLPELAHGNISATVPRWKELSVGPHRFRMDPE